MTTNIQKLKVFYNEEHEALSVLSDNPLLALLLLKDKMGRNNIVPIFQTQTTKLRTVETHPIRQTLVLTDTVINGISLLPLNYLSSLKAVMEYNQQPEESKFIAGMFKKPSGSEDNFFYVDFYEE
ncbi:MAG: hypothetical protein M0R77_01025 [Gammaproteobacteria bacterium]|nr:hypothetical protein [Acholeplasmataceae bacterium]MCK9529138.1 hypothetical protein [Gammaproteobacteria bacterium]